MPSDLENKLEIRFDNIHPRYVELVEKVFENVGEGFFTSPASTKFHHHYTGGLCEHTREVYHLAYSMGTYFQLKVNMNVLQCGALFHDIGKVGDYQPKILKSGKQSEKEPYKRTPTSKTLEHLGEGLVIVQEAGQEIGFPRNKLTPIFHIIGSHHGDKRRGWGSLIDPQSAEAHIVHHADMVSSRVSPKPNTQQARVRR